MTDNEVMIKIIRWMMKDVKNLQFKNSLQYMIDRLQNKKHIEEEDDPRYHCIQFGYFDMFDLPIEKYREMAKEIDEQSL